MVFWKKCFLFFRRKECQWKWRLSVKTIVRWPGTTCIFVRSFYQCWSFMSTWKLRFAILFSFCFSAGHEGTSVYASFQSTRSGNIGSRHFPMAVSRNSESISHATSELLVSNSRPMTAVSGAGYQSVRGKSSNFFLFASNRFHITVFRTSLPSCPIFNRRCAKTRSAMERNQRRR
jgi:hypothetical protein